jgi:hypothetical protein
MRFGRVIGLQVAACAAVLLVASNADAGCGCDKPPPPLAAIRPFVTWSGGTVTLFDARLVPGTAYRVGFDSVTDRWQGWADGVAEMQPDLADGQLRAQLRVVVPRLGYGPQRVRVSQGSVMLYELDPSQLTVTAPPIALRDTAEASSTDQYRAGVGTDGTVYIAVDVTNVADATSFRGAAVGFPLSFTHHDITMYNAQGFLMQSLPEAQEGVLFEVTARKRQTSSSFSYWRHEFQTYNAEHRSRQDRQLDATGNWHADGSYHVDHDHIVIAIHGTMPNGQAPQPGGTPEFRLSVESTPAPIVVP